MTGVWVTNSSTTVEAMINPLTAALDGGFVPERIHLLENPEVVNEVDHFVQLTETVFTAYETDLPTVERTSLDDEVQFERIRTHHRDAIEDARNQG